MKNKKKILLIIILLLFTFSCLIGTLYLLNKKNQEKLNEKVPLSANDFKENLYDEYNLLNCDITKDSLTFYLSNIKVNDYESICNNINNIMKKLKETKTNCEQTNITFYLYEKNIQDYKNNLEDEKIEYILNNKFAYITTIQKIPNIENSNGLLPYEFISYDNENLKISMDLSSLSLYDKISQIKTFYEIASSLNKDISNLVINVEDKNFEYIYNNTNEITIIEKIEW